MEREVVFERVSCAKALVGRGDAILAFGKRLLPGLVGEDIPGVTRRCEAWF
ncbi:hypothetical protein [Archaeoglobus neptunius]|uniref:hypothetical protein n=1 Tax=Archaeoglobus neptunius TaxID=2798580 RepID=UPI00192856B4|nr:hypothetical protein [Archaeoglobus neptunius]